MGGLWPWWGRWEKFIRRTRNGARLCRGPRCAHGKLWPQPHLKIAPDGWGAKNPLGAPRWAGYSLGGRRGRSSSAGLEMGLDFARDLGVLAGSQGQNWAQKSHPMDGVPKRPQGSRDERAIALVGGAGELCPRDSDWGKTLPGTSVCPWRVTGTATPKNKSPNVGAPKPPNGKRPRDG